MEKENSLTTLPLRGRYHFFFQMEIEFGLPVAELLIFKFAITILVTPPSYIKYFEMDVHRFKGIKLVQFIVLLIISNKTVYFRTHVKNNNKNNSNDNNILYSFKIKILHTCGKSEKASFRCVVICIITLCSSI